MTVHPKAIEKLVKEYQAGKRKIILCGSDSIENGFQLHPTSLDDIDLLLIEGSISREVTVEEAVGLAANKHCQNKPAIYEFLKQLNALIET